MLHRPVEETPKPVGDDDLVFAEDEVFPVEKAFPDKNLNNVDDRFEDIQPRKLSSYLIGCLVVLVIFITYRIYFRGKYSEIFRSSKHKPPVQFSAVMPASTIRLKETTSAKPTRAADPPGPPIPLHLRQQQSPPRLSMQTTTNFS